MADMQWQGSGSEETCRIYVMQSNRECEDLLVQVPINVFQTTV